MATTRNRERERQRMGNIARRIGRRLGRDRSAQGMAEYALLAGLVALVAIGAITLLGNNIKGTLNSIAGSVGAAS
jgi:Flp pilus assembly pilin Flp